MSKSMRYSRRLPYKIPGATHEMYSGCDVRAIKSELHFLAP